MPLLTLLLFTIQLLSIVVLCFIKLIIFLYSLIIFLLSIIINIIIIIIIIIIICHLKNILCYDLEINSRRSILFLLIKYNKFVIIKMFSIFYLFYYKNFYFSVLIFSINNNSPCFICRRDLEMLIWILLLLL